MQRFNSTTIKFCTLVVMLLGNVKLNSQEIYGTDPEKCKQKLSIMTTYYKQKDYASAAPSWRYLIKNCPQASKNTFIIGSEIMELFVKEATSPEQKAQYVDSLLMNQDLRLTYFPESEPNKQLAKKAIYLLRYRLKKEYKTAFSLLDSAFVKGPEELTAYDLKMYLYCYKLMVKSKVKTCEQMLDTYLAVSDIIGKREAKGKKIKEKTKNQITEYAEICMDCNLLDSLYGANFDLRKQDTTWLDNGIQLFKRKKCNSSQTFLLLLETRYISRPNANTASTLGKYYLNTQDYTKAGKYFDDAITLAVDSSKLAGHHLNKSKYLIATNKYQSAFYESKKAISQDQSSSAAYLIAGDALAYSASQCKNLTFSGKEMYWLAIDYYNKAVKLSSSEKEKQTARNKIGKFKQFFPEKGDLFLKSLTEGQSYKVACFVNETTKVRSRK